MSTEEVKMKETIPLWLAVPITIIVALPFGLWLGKWNLTLWCSFIVWAEYFALGAKPSALKLILPSFAYGALFTGAAMFTVAVLGPVMPSLVTSGDLTIMLSLAVWVGFMVYSMKWSKTVAEGSLALFNGISMLLALYLSGSFPKTGIALAEPWMATFWTILSGYFGAFLGWFNVTILFPRKVK